jgi:hypothetical protein
MGHEDGGWMNHDQRDSGDASSANELLKREVERIEVAERLEWIAAASEVLVGTKEPALPEDSRQEVVRKLLIVGGQNASAAWHQVIEDLRRVQGDSCAVKAGLRSEALQLLIRAVETRIWRELLVVIADETWTYVPARGERLKVLSADALRAHLNRICSKEG